MSQADRVAATRQARRDVGASLRPEDAQAHGAGLTRRAERMLVARANALLSQLVPRHPFVAGVLGGKSGITWLGGALLTGSIVFGGMLSALDGSNRIDILAFPFLGLLLWSLCVYVVVIVDAVRPRRVHRAWRRIPAFAGRISLAIEKRSAGKSKSFVAPLGTALERFVDEWSDLARPLTTARATRVFHVCAIGVGIGLVAGLYLRGLVLDYQAGWESTFLDGGSVRTLLSILYGPASVLTGIAVPGVEHLESIRWEGMRGGERAAPWIHLIAASVLLYILLPRALLAALNTLSIWRWSLRAPVPAWLPSYFRSVFGANQALDKSTLNVITYAYGPSPDAVAQLGMLLRSAFASESAIDIRDQIAYGDEQAFLRSFTVDESAGELFILLLSLAATPEEENHGVLMEGLRDRLGKGAFRAALLVMIDEGPYAMRMAAQGGAEERMNERRRAWETFAREREVDVYFVNLTGSGRASADAGTAQTSEVERLRAALQNLGGLKV